ncbi:MAG: hypothetical protein P8Z00_19425 [Anaerolineales bacterium]
MKNKLIFAGMAAATLLSAAVQAAPATVSDSALEAISGKANTAGSTSATIGLTTSVKSDNSANIQFGFYQWSDAHTTDASNLKGGNRTDGSSSAVQASVTGENNAYYWGGLGQNNLDVAGDLSGGSNMGYGTFANGGF